MQDLLKFYHGHLHSLVHGRHLTIVLELREDKEMQIYAESTFRTIHPLLPFLPQELEDNAQYSTRFPRSFHP